MSLIHELGHIKSMNFFGRKHNKVGFKMNFYVFSFFLCSTKRYLYVIQKRKAHCSFSRYLHKFIHYFNVPDHQYVILENGYVVGIIYFLLLALLWNVIPVLNSDGYKILLTLLNKDEFENSKKVGRAHDPYPPPASSS